MKRITPLAGTDAALVVDFDGVQVDLRALESRINALAYQSGWRNVAGVLETGITGNVFIARFGNTVHMMFNSVIHETGGNANIYLLPSGFRPANITGGNWRHGQVATDTGDSVRNTSYYNQRMRILNMEAGKAYQGYIVFETNEAIPTTLPGVAA